MLTGKEVESVILYLNHYDKEVSSVLEENEDRTWTNKYSTSLFKDKKEYFWKVLNKKSYKNSKNEEFEVYKVENFANNELLAAIYVIKISENKYFSITYILKIKKYELLCTTGFLVLGRNLEEMFIVEIGKKIKKKTRDVIKQICLENDLLFKNQLKYLLNKEKKEQAYFIIDKLIFN